MSNVIDKLKKLIAMEQSSRAIGNQAEAEAFATKISSLLTEHKLTMTEVEYEAQAKTDPFGRQTVAQKGGGSTPEWRLVLSRAIADAMFCETYYSSGRNAVTFVGRDSDRSAAVALYEYLASVGKSLASKELRAEKKQRIGPVDHIYYPTDNHWTKSFLLGYAHGIQNRLRVEHTKQLATGNTGLMRRDSILLKEYVLSTVRLTTGTSRKSHPLSSSAYDKGKTHGSAVPLGQKLGLGSGR